MKLVFLDEFGANLGMVPTYGRARRGKRVRIDKPCYRAPNITFSGAMSLSGLLTVDCLPGSATIDNFVSWVKDHLASHLQPGHVVVMDNLRSHRNAAAIAAIEETGATLKFLPPYSPDLNPIEECWSKVKGFIRKACARTQDALLTAVAMVHEIIEESDVRGWFTHAGYLPSGQST